MTAEDHSGFDAAADDLRDALGHAADALKNAGIRVAGGIALQDGLQLWFGRRGAKWGLYTRVGELEVDLQQQSLEIRIKAAYSLSALEAHLRELQSSRVRDMVTAAAVARRYAADLAARNAEGPCVDPE